MGRGGGRCWKEVRRQKKRKKSPLSLAQQPFFFSAFQTRSLGFTILGQIFFPIDHRGSHNPSFWMVHAGYVFAVGHECQDLLSQCDGMHTCTD